MDALAGHAVAYNIGSIFKHIIDCVQLYFTNGFTNPVLSFRTFGAQKIHVHTLKSRHTQNESLIGADFGPEA